MEKLIAAAFGALLMISVINTFLTIERIQSQRELNGTMKAFNQILERDQRPLSNPSTYKGE